MKYFTPKHRNIAVKTFVKKVRKKVKNIKPKGYIYLRDSFIEALKDAGFVRYSCGGYKSCYINKKDFPEFIVKVYDESYGHRNDTCLSRIPRWVKEHFLYPVAKNYLYIIQPLANKDKGKWKKSASKSLFSIISDEKKQGYLNDIDAYDTRNIMFHNGRPVIIDFCA